MSVKFKRTIGISENALIKHCLKCGELNNKYKIKNNKNNYFNKIFIKYCLKCNKLNKKYEKKNLEKFYCNKNLNKKSILSLEGYYNKQNIVTLTNNGLIDNYIQKNSLNSYKNQEKLIISLTSYPARIKFVKLVLESLVNQFIPFSVYHIVLVLAIPEFPNKENDLPVDLMNFIHKYPDLIEILWYEKNIISHKKLIPTLNKYPNNPILICDDDIIRKPWWIKMFLEDHLKYPNDIIFGASKQYLTPELKWESYKYLYIKTKAGRLNAVKNIIVNTGKPMNGFGGTLYPKNTFTDKRFFNENLFMKLSPTSDESWQWCFNIIENKTLRQSSKIYDYTKDIIKDSQVTSLYKVNDKKYDLILKNIINEFPDLKKKLDEKFKLIHYKYCLCTILNDDYVIGFETMLFSFYKHNNWFNGDILIIHDDKYSILSNESKKRILYKFPNVKFLKIDTLKYSKINLNFIPKKFIPPLIKFEIFGLTDYDKVLYIDSDTLVLSNIYELFNNNENIICFTHEKYKVKNKEIWNNIHDEINTNINNGVIFINKNMLDKTHIDRMLNLTYKYDKSFPHYNGCPDQDIMQVYFQENNIKVTLESNIYNTMKRVFYGNIRYVSNEKIIHYIIKKPWNSNEPEYKYINNIWHNYYNELDELYSVKINIENDKQKLKKQKKDKKKTEKPIKKKELLKKQKRI
ncbi:nucleotide-diphospho-sugar transferase [Neocallimastix lanati (nom. inval.)]|nr:nucleotide-diphospho-sugar transferase [Neocallimastix sp. JGI-2020a]